MRAFSLLFLLGCLLPNARAQHLEEYIQTALANNLELSQQEFSYQEAQARLDQAKALFWPKVSINGRYSLAEGGRTIDFPVGDLVNPAYQNLNRVNQFISGNDPTYPAYPTYAPINNEQTSFLRATEQETTIRLEMPVYNQALLHNRQIQENLVDASEATLAGFRRQLAKDVEQAYYTYAQAYYGRQILADALALVRENLRTTQSLQTYHQATAADVYTAEAQVAGILQELAVARQREQSAQAYFNTLLNRDYTAAIQLPAATVEAPLSALSVTAAQQQAFQQRAELQQLNFYLAAAEQQRKIATGNRLPTVNLRTDYGVQGTTYSFGADDDFVMASVVFAIPLFDRSTSAKVQEATLAQQRLGAQQAAAEQQIGLQIVNQYYALTAAQEQIKQAKARRTAAGEAFRLQQRLYEQGQSNQVTWQNARTNLTTAEQQLVIAQYNYLIQLAEWEWASGE